MKRSTSLLKAHFSVLLFGLSGVLAKLIEQSSVVVTCGRSLIGALVLGVFLMLSKRFRLPSKAAYSTLLLSGLLLAVHWICFYQSVKVASVSIGVISVSTFPIMTAIVEPLVLKSRWRLRLIIDPLLVVVGTVILLGTTPGPSDAEGLAWGFTSAAIYVVIHFINKMHVREMEGSMLSFVQLAIAGVVLLPFLISGWDSTAITHRQDIVLMVLLGVFSTAIAYSFFIESMRRLSASTAAVLCGLEPVYAIAISLMFLGESFRWNLLIGAAIILLSVVHSSYSGAAEESPRVDASLDSTP